MTTPDLYTVDRYDQVRIFENPAKPNAEALEAMGLRPLTSDELTAFLSYGATTVPTTYAHPPAGHW